jgi:hypothetical protein
VGQRAGNGLSALSFVCNCCRHLSEDRPNEANQGEPPLLKISAFTSVDDPACARYRGESVLRFRALIVEKTHPGKADAKLVAFFAKLGVSADFLRAPAF